MINKINQMIPDGVWPTMITPFTKENKVDYHALEEMVEWYIGQNVAGLFAVCQSSEMTYLSLKERVDIAKFVKKQTAGRVNVIASGHISDNLEMQIKELNEMAETGVDAVVLVSSRIAKKEESDDIWKKNLELILKNVPEDMVYGFYECPAPYKRLISPELLKWCGETGKFGFLKDTSCDVANMQAKLNAISGTELKIFNANSATLLDTLKIGVAGFSGIMANFHPDLYAWLVINWKKEPQKAEKIMNFLGFASTGSQPYPVSAKYHMKLEGIHIDLTTRSRNANELNELHKLAIKQLRETAEIFREDI